MLQISVITVEQIQTLVTEKIEGTNTFIIDIQVHPTNRIVVELDNDQGMAINECVAVSRYIERSFDRDEEDFELSVSSPGLDKPLRVTRQYVKNVGRELLVKTTDERKIKGLLSEADDAGIVVTTRTKERVEGRKKKEWVEQRHELTYEIIKEAKIVVSFN